MSFMADGGLELWSAPVLGQHGIRALLSALCEVHQAHLPGPWSFCLPLSLASLLPVVASLQRRLWHSLMRHVYCARRKRSKPGLAGVCAWQFLGTYGDSPRGKGDEVDSFSPILEDCASCLCVCM